MKKVPMILLLIAPYAIVFLCDQTGLDFSIGFWIYGALLVFNMVYAILLPRLGFRVKQILFWNLLLKLCHIPLILLILVFTLVMMLAGGEGIRDEASSMVLIALLLCYLIQVSSAMFGISGFRWYRKYGTLSKAGMIASSIAQFIPCIDVIGSIPVTSCSARKGKFAECAVRCKYPRPSQVGDELFLGCFIWFTSGGSYVCCYTSFLIKQPKLFYSAALKATCGVAAKNEVNTFFCRPRRRAMSMAR